MLGQHHADRNVRLLDKVDHRRARMGLTNSELTLLALQLPFMKISESMGNHDSKIVDAGSVG